MTALASIMAILSLCLWGVQDAPRESNQAENWKIAANLPLTDWNPRSLSYSELRKLGFSAPTALPQGYTQKNARVAWVVKDLVLPKVPARRAVWIRYEDASRHWFEIIEARHIRGIGLWDNVETVLAFGYFRKDLPVGTYMHLGTRHGVDFLIYGSSLKHKALETIVNSCPVSAN